MRSRIVVLHIISGLSTGGAERALYNLLRGGLAERFDCHVVSLGSVGTIGPQIKKLNVPVTALNMRGGRPLFAGIRALRQVVRECRPDVIQGWMYHGNLAAVLARRIDRGRPSLAMNVRHSLYQLRYEKLSTRQVIRANRFLSRSADMIIYNSQLSRQQHEAFGFHASNGRVIPNGIDIQQFSFSSSLRRTVRASLDIPEDANVVGHVARFHPMKNHAAFLQVASDLAEHDPSIFFLLSGKDVSLANKALEQIIPVNVRCQFRLLGERGDVSSLMNAMDVFCVSSAWGEAFPNVLGEAMATQVPCVATDVGDSAAIIGDTGNVVPIGDTRALAAAIKDLLSKPVKERSAVGAEARERIEKNFAMPIVVDQYSALYEEMTLAKGQR